MRKKPNATTSWEKASSWYDQAVGQTGHYYHDHVIFPKLLPWISKEVITTCSILDLACGQGIVSRLIPPSWDYVGIDLSPSLLQAAKEKAVSSSHQFLLGDITKPLPTTKKDFSVCTFLLAMQNLQHPLQALQNAAKHLMPGGRLFIVMNHPCFRIPKASHWGVDEALNIQYRRMDSYLSQRRIPIQLHPSQGKDSPCTFSFHHPLSTWSSWLQQAGFYIEMLDEWCSDKVSTGKHALREDKSRKEFPLFLAIKATKIK
ncbi:MAG: class I SAM-dependent methyltransferase [Chlamydiae bacterium]|nr:class I SAM-dependent methyltransferase [Chlamydiota bacterium]